MVHVDRGHSVTGENSIFDYSLRESKSFLYFSDKFSLPGLLVQKCWKTEFSAMNDVRTNDWCARAQF